MTRHGPPRLFLLLLGLLYLALPCRAAEKSDPIAAAKTKLQLLERAKQAGLLTPAEYAQKRATIETELKAAIEATIKPDKTASADEMQQKLDTLEAAFKAGLLTRKEYHDKRSALIKAAATPKTPDEPAETPTPKITELKLPPKLANAKTFRHPTGFTFDYPATWKVTDTGEGIQLEPDDVATGPDGPTERYLIVTQTVPDTSRVDDPWLVRFYENQIRQVAPFLRGEPETQPALTRKGRGVVAIWHGRAPTRRLYQARAYITVLEGFGLVLAGLGEKPQVLSRELVLRQIFASFAIGKAERDPKLVTTWRTQLFALGSLTGVTRTLLLRANGTCFIADARGGKPAALPATQGVRPGRWGSAGDQLHIAWPSGLNLSYTYTLKEVDGRRSLWLEGADGKKAVWREVR
ncbi:hypothetical protein HQ576_00975 [bacterium]|nr:hypothetical protein [bacterium]